MSLKAGDRVRVEYSLGKGRTSLQPQVLTLVSAPFGRVRIPGTKWCDFTKDGRMAMDTMTRLKRDLPICYLVKCDAEGTVEPLFK